MLKPYHNKFSIEIGVDEVGRGSLVGPVVASAVVLPKTYRNSSIKDSKKIPKHLHRQLSDDIKNSAIAWTVAEASQIEIEKHNILNATYLAMHRAVKTVIQKLNETPKLILVDGNRFDPYPSIAHLCIIKGDYKYLSIAAASIIAKQCRDAKLLKWHKTYPMYGWNTNSGYSTKKHRQAIQEYGVSPLHRKTFRIKRY